MAGHRVITIGSFDGVHLGHRSIVASARRLAERGGCSTLALTFDPHPARTLRPGSEPPRLTSVPEKVDRLRAAGASEVVVLKPTTQVLRQSPQTFVERLVEEYKPLAIVEGEDFRFGRGRAGDTRLLRELGGRMGFEAVVEPKVEMGLSNRMLVPVSSSLIRWLIGRGRMLDATICLGRAFELTGSVATGEQRGRAIGVPTANLDPASYTEHMVPADGVYSGLVQTPDGRLCPAAISVGIRPTFGQRTLAIEAHLLDFEGDLYGSTISIRFMRWLRDQQAFLSKDVLRQQLHLDIAHTRRLLEQGLLE